MPERIRIDTLDRLPPGTGKTYPVGDRTIAVFNVGGDLYAIDDRCPHRGASLGRGILHDAVVNCPLHGWAFDLRSGQCVDRSGYGLERFDVFLEGENVILDVTPDASDANSEPDGIHRYLVRYGAMGWVGRFGSIERIECGYRDRVLVHTSRGVEIGVVLTAPGGSTGGLDAHKPAGELLRRLTPEDERQAAEIGDVPADLLEECRGLLAEQSALVEILDAERLFDGETVVFYYLGEPSPRLDDVSSRLETVRQVRVLFQPVVDPPVPAGGACNGCSCGA